MVKGSADDLITVSQFAKELQVEGLINANCMRQSLKLQLLEAKQAVQIQLDTLEEDDVQIQLDTLEEGDIQSELDSPSMLTQQEVSETHDVKVEANGTQSELSSLLPEEEEDLCIVYETTTGTSWPKKGISNKKNPCLPPALIPIEKLADTEPVQLSVDPQLCQAPLPHDLMLQPSTKVACKRPASDIAPLKHPKKSNRAKEANADPKLLESCSPATDNLPRPPTTQRKIPCRVCGVYFDTPLELRIHREASHANVLECGVCKKILSSKKSLKIHLRNHIKRLDLNISNAAELTKWSLFDLFFSNSLQIIERANAMASDTRFAQILCAVSVVK